MDKLIDQLQETLDEDEAAKEALLQLRNVSNGTEQAFPGASKALARRSTLMQQSCVSELGNCFIFELIISAILRACTDALDLPLKIVSCKLDVNCAFLANICKTQTLYTTWEPNTIDNVSQIVDVFEIALERGVCIATSAQRDRLKCLKEELSDVKDAPRGAAARFVLSAILDAVLAHSTPLPLERPGSGPQLQNAHSAAAPPSLQTREVNLGSLHPAYDPQVPRKVMLLAPLESRRRSPKHFIVPLMEPDVFGRYADGVTPQVASLLPAAPPAHQD